MAQIPAIHTTGPDGGTEAICGQARPDEEVVDLAEVLQPDGQHFTCHGCIDALRRGQEDMAGDRP